jgi:hypothetical protein
MVDLSQYNPPVGNQGSVNSCSSWATAYYLRGWYAKRDGYYPGGPDSLGGFEPMYIYSRQSQPGQLGFNHGMTMDGNLNVMKNEGVDTRIDYWQGDLNQVDPSTPNEDANAARYKIASYTTFSNSGGTSMQGFIEQTLASGNPLAIALNIYSDNAFYNLNSTNYVLYPPAAGTQVVNVHDVFAYKYDQTGLWIENQWGTGWGNHGYAELSWTFVNQAVGEAVTMVPITPLAPPVQPNGTLIATADGSLYRITGGVPVYVPSYSAAGWNTEYSYQEDETLPGGGEYDCTPTNCSGIDDDPNDPTIISVRDLSQYP